MDTLMEKINGMAFHSTFNARTAELFERLYLDILTEGDEQVRCLWIDECPANEILTGMFYKLFCRRVTNYGQIRRMLRRLAKRVQIQRRIALEQRIKGIASYAELSPRMALLIKLSFDDMATNEEEEELSAWFHQNIANDQLYEALCDAKYGKLGVDPIKILRKLPMRGEKNGVHSIIRRLTFPSMFVFSWRKPKFKL